MQAAAMKQDMMAPNTCEYFIEKEVVKEKMEELTKQKIISKKTIRGFRKLAAVSKKRKKHYDELNAEVEKRIALLRELQNSL